MPSSLTLLQQWLSTEPAVLLKTILRGRTPSTALMQRHGWWLIMLFFVPTVILDLRAVTLRKTDEEEQDGERQRDKLRHKLDRIIGAVGRHQVSGSDNTPEEEEAGARFDALAVQLLLAYAPAEPGAENFGATDSSNVGMKWELVNDSVKACYRFEKNSARMVAGVTALTRILMRELAEATEKTDIGQEERYLDGEELERAYTVLDDANAFLESRQTMCACACVRACVCRVPATLCAPRRGAKGSCQML